MNRPRFSLTLILAATISWVAGCTRFGKEEPLTIIRYQGIEVPTSRPYADIDDFKADAPRHLSDASFEAIESALRSAKFGPDFSGTEEALRTLDELRVPGYGSFYANQLGAKIDRQLELVYVEVPQKPENRYIVLRSDQEGRLSVIADFFAPSDPELVRVESEPNGRLTFRTTNGTVAHTRNAA